MKHRMFSLMLAMASMVAACDSHTATAPDARDELVGSWISTGVDIAPGMVSLLKPRTVEATFDANDTYAVVVTDSAGAVVVFSGTWMAVGTPGSVREITLRQASIGGTPTTGIFQVTDRTLTLEIVQGPAAAFGFVAPTVSGGFGSTSYGGVALGDTWTQKFERAAEVPSAQPCNDSELNVASKRPCVPGWSGTAPKR